MKRLLIMALILSGSIPYIWAAQLDADILANEEIITPTFSFLRIIYIEYPEGGEIAEMLRGQKQSITFTADSDTPGMRELVNKINQNLKTLPSTVFVTDTKINYQAILNGNQNSAVIELKLQLIPAIANSVIMDNKDSRTIDANWRGLSIDSPIVFETAWGLFDANNPKNALDVMIPDTMNKFTEVDIDILEMPLVDSSEILKLPLHRWHSLFDNTAIIASSEQFNFTGKYVLTHYSMGECNLEIGFCQDRKWVQDFELDKKYKITMIESRDDASITIEGYVDFSSMGEIETFEASLFSPISEKPATDEFPATVMYGMAGLAAIGGAAMFTFSNRKLKKDHEQGQTGIDPSQLRVYETSISAGGYKTNRGEAHIASFKSKSPVSY